MEHLLNELLLEGGELLLALHLFIHSLDCLHVSTYV